MLAGGYPGRRLDETLGTRDGWEIENGYENEENEIEGSSSDDGRASGDGTHSHLDPTTRRTKLPELIRGVE